MTVVDPNVLVRRLTGDDLEQAAAAKSLVASQPIWIAQTVLLETGWVLGSLYGFNEDAVRGLEFADALHLCSRPPGAPFVSFDQSFVRAAQRAGVSGISGVSARNSR